MQYTIVKQIFLLSLILIAGRVSAIEKIEFVPIQYPGNTPNKYGYGAVDYIYDISKYEITNNQYCGFLNCVARKTDPYRLFSPLMQQHFLGGIIRNGEVGDYSYKCKSGYENRPIVGVTWMSAIRFINWLHYNADNIDNEVPLTYWRTQTEGTDILGAYDTRAIPYRRNQNALFWLPNRSEWEKAAYYDGEAWLIDSLLPNANCFNSQSGWAQPFPHIAEVGLSEGPNGTFDQQGNAAEWIENATESGEWKLALGGSLIRPKEYAYCGALEGDDPNKAISTFGFRICKTMNNCDSGVIIKTDTPSKIMGRPVTPPRLQNHDSDKTMDNQGTIYVRITDPNNQGDPINRYKGSVPYEYDIARTELSNAQYCAFLNAVASIADPYHLFNENMETGVCGGIARIKDSVGVRYVPKPGWENKPIVYISFYDLARYANWMHYGCPNKGISEIGTTEGTDSQGAYDTRDFEIVREGIKAPYKNFGMRNVGAQFWIPNEDEWFKAAYYDPSLIGTRKYYNYPTRTNDAPGQDKANYVVDDDLAIGEPYFVTDVDSYGNAASYYGTVQQGGNVWEWIESWQYGQIGNRGLKGGSWSYTAFGLNACNTDPGGINDRSYVFGGRLCRSVDESGWYPASKPFSQSLYEFVMLLSPKKIIFMLFFLVGMGGVLMCLVIGMFCRHLWEKH